MESVDVLGGVERVDDSARIDLTRQRQLHQHAVNLGIGIELADETEQLGLGNAGAGPVLEIPEARVERGLVLGAHIDLARGILAHEHGREARHHAMLALQSLRRFRHTRTERRRPRLAVDQPRDHGRNPSAIWAMSAPGAPLTATTFRRPLTPRSTAKSRAGR